MSIFKPSDKSRAILRELRGNLAEEAEKKFFDIWEAEVADPLAPRLSGSVIANAYMGIAARFAVFGCECAGREPRLELWLELAKEQFEDAIKHCAAAKEAAAEAEAKPIKGST